MATPRSVALGTRVGPAVHVDCKTLKYIFFILVINENHSGTGNTIMAEPE